MRWMFLACFNFVVAIFLISALIVTQTQPLFAISKDTFSKLRYNMTQKEMTTTLGAPHFKYRDKWVYRGENQSSLTIYWDYDTVANISISFPLLPALSELVEIDGSGILKMKTSDDLLMQGWAKIGIPDKGIIFQINRDGHIRNMTWESPWTNSGNVGDILSLLTSLRDLPPYAYSE